MYKKDRMTTEQTLRIALEAMARANENQSRQIEELTAQIAWFQRQMFGRKSERHIPLGGQLSLFADDISGTVVQKEPGTGASSDGSEDAKRKERKPTPRQRQIWENLPVLETRTIEPEGVDLTRYRRIGEETTYLLGFEPGKLFRIAVVRPKYGLKDSTEPVERGEGVLIAPVPKLPIPKGMPSASLLSEILLQKYEYHVPFYRQIKQFAHLGMTSLKEAMLTGWFKQTMELLHPLYEALVAEVFASDYIQADIYMNLFIMWKNNGFLIWSLFF